MKIFGVLFLLLVLVACIGFFRGWFSMSSEPPNQGNREVNVNLKVDQDKMESDANAVKEKVQELTGKAQDKVNQK